MSGNYLNDLHQMIEKILDNHNIKKDNKNLRVHNSDGLEANLFGFIYTFEKAAGHINVRRSDGKQSYIELFEIPLIENIAMPRMIYVKKFNDEGNIKKEKFTDVAVRLNLIMEGDIYECISPVFYIAAGTHKTTDLFVAAP